MNKPASMSFKEWIIKKMSIQLVIPEKVIDQVVTHQFDSANDALNINKTVELSGFGTFHFNQKKAVTQYNKLLAIEKAYNNDKRTFQTDINELVDAPTSIGYQVLNGSNSIRDKIETGKLSCNKFYSISSEEEKKNFLHYALKDYFENGFKHGKILDIYKDDINQIGIEKFIPNMSYLASRLKLSIVPKEKDNYYNAFSFKYKYFKEAFDISKINFDFYIDDDDDDTYSNLKLTRALNNFKTLKELANDF